MWILHFSLSFVDSHGFRPGHVLLQPVGQKPLTLLSPLPGQHKLTSILDWTSLNTEYQSKFHPRYVLVSLLPSGTELTIPAQYTKENLHTRNALKHCVPAVGVCHDLTTASGMEQKYPNI